MALAISPDGRSVVFQAGQDPPRLWLRTLDSQEARPLAGTDGAVFPFWSPDSRSVGVHRGWYVETARSRQRPRAHAGKPLRDGRVLEPDGNNPHGQRHRAALQRPGGGGRRHAGHGSAAGTDQRIAGRSFSPMAGRFLLFTLGINGCARRVSRVHDRHVRATRIGERIRLRDAAARSCAVRPARRAVGARASPRFHVGRGRARAGCAEGAGPPADLRLRRLLLVIDRVDRLSRVGR